MVSTGLKIYIHTIAYFYYVVVTTLTVPLDKEMRGCFFHHFLTLDENFCVNKLAIL